MTDIKRKAKAGLLLLTSSRFEKLGEGTKDGTYDTRKRNEAERLIESFSEFADVTYCGLCYNSEDAKESVSAFRRENVDFVTVIFMSWSEDFAFIHALRELCDLPVFYASIVREEIGYRDTFDENDFVDFLSYGSVVGFLEGSGSLRRYAPEMCEIFCGSLYEVTEKVRIFATAARARAILKTSVVSLLSHYNEIMWATYVDPYNIFKTFGAELHFLSITDLIALNDKTDDGEVTAITKELSEKYRMADDVDYEKFHASVKASMAMEKLAETVNTDLLVLNDVEKPLLENIGLRPGFSPLYGESSPTVVPEGDVGAGLAAYILKLISGGHVNFIEPFYIDAKRDAFAAGHAGPNDYTECPENVIIGRDTRFAKSSYKHAGAPFAWYVYPKGLKTILHMSECNGKIKMAFSTMECLETKHYLASYSHADFTHTQMSNKKFFTELATFGVTQHYAITNGDYTSELEAFAKLYGFEYLKI